MDRVIGEYGIGGEGALIIVLAGIHGNEKAGINALHQLFQHFEEDQVEFRGKIVGLAGNVVALENNTRFIHKDLNRQWYASKIKKLHALPFGMLNTQEDREQKQLFTRIEHILLDKHQYEKVLLIDLHTTSAKGGCFSITNDIPSSAEFAMMMPVPVISGITKLLKGTTLEYFESLHIPGFAFEAGQHVEEASVGRMKAAIMSVAHKMECIDAHEYDKFSDDLEELWQFNKGLPYMVKLIYHHGIAEEDHFVMNPGYKNFQAVSKGELLAKDKNGDVLAPEDGLILMPLYQKKGSDGFFLVEKVDVNVEAH